MKLALADEYVAVSLALRVDRAECGGTKSSTHALHFLSTQVTSAPANQYSVQVIHVLSPFVVGPVEPAQSSARESLFSGAFRRSRKRLTAHLADVLISIRRRRIGAARKSNKASVDHLGFRGRQLASAPANQYSVLVFHVFLLSPLRPLKQSSSRDFCPADNQW